MSNYLPPELLTKILEQLPVKCLIRCTTVCKDWRSLITSPSFIASHLSNTKSDTPLIFDGVNQFSLIEFADNEPFCINSSSKFELPYSSRNSYKFVGVCNGVICLMNEDDHSIFLWNPSIKTNLSLPDGIIKLKRLGEYALGFGVDNDDYKVVRLVYDEECFAFGITGNLENSMSPKVEIFSVKTRTWRKLSGIDFKLRIIGNDDLCTPVFLNGIVHWLGYNGLHGKDGYCCSVLTFSIANEVFDELALPDELSKEDVEHMSLPLIVESLYVIKHDIEFYDVWSMKKDESWTRLYRIQLDLVDKDILEVFGFCKSGEVLLSLAGSYSEELVAYSPENMQMTNIGLNWSFSYSIYNYVESLVLLQAG